MKFAALISALVLFSTALLAKDNLQDTKYVSNMKEMTRLVSVKSPSRTYLYCALLSSNLKNYDVYGLFIRKASTEANNADAFEMALAYMMGFFESELLDMKGQSSSKEDLDKVLLGLYSTECMKYTLPQQH